MPKVKTAAPLVYPKIRPPIKAPTIPIIMFAIQPNLALVPVTSVASHPAIPPIIIQPMIPLVESPLTFLTALSSFGHDY